MPAKTFTSASLPEHLNHQERFRLWRDIYYAEVASVEVGISDLPFEASLEANAIGPLTFAKMSATINRAARTPHHIRVARTETYLFTINLGKTLIAGHPGESDMTMPTGSAILHATQAQEFVGNTRNSWANLALPRKLVDDKFPGMEGRQGALVPSDNEALTLLRNYLAMLESTDLPVGSVLFDHVSETIVDLFGLATGAKGGEAELVGTRGLRAGRLQAVLRQIKSNYRNPALSAPVVGLQLGLSGRYVQDLLASTGGSFSERILELRLQDAKTMLTDARHQDKRIGDIAMEVGFSDISYFNRSFKKRFGCNPGAAR